MPDIAGPGQNVVLDDRALAISEMSERFDVTLRTLRFYEEKGLLNPVRKGARRFYGARDVSRMRVILQAKKIGLTLAEIRRVIKTGGKQCKSPGPVQGNPGNLQKSAGNPC
ncbi:MerR family transcriptional regulator [Roseibium salinum]|nr:MerR family transcriptional regulator [Roseibium salinum]